MTDYNGLILDKQRYSKYMQLSEWLGEAAARYHSNAKMESESENSVEEKQNARINRLAAANEYSAYARQFRQTYQQYADNISQYNGRAKDLNEHAFGQLPSRIIEDHIDSMNKAYNKTIGSTVNPFSRDADWNIRDLDALSQ